MRDFQAIKTSIGRNFQEVGAGDQRTELQAMHFLIFKKFL